MCPSMLDVSFLVYGKNLCEKGQKKKLLGIVVLVQICLNFWLIAEEMF